MRPFTLRARWLATMDGPPIEGGYLTIAAGRIAAVNARPIADAGPVTDLGDVVLTPGLVNPHTHLEFSNLRAPLGARGMPLPQWIRGVIAERRRADRDGAAAIAAGLAESLARGVTTIGEIATQSAAAYGGGMLVRSNRNCSVPSAPGSARGRRGTASRGSTPGQSPGLRRHAYSTPALVSPTDVRPTPTAVLLQEAIGFSAQRVESVVADVEQRLAAAAGHALGVSPHAPYTAHPQLVARLAQLAAQRGMPIALHLAESPEELELLSAGRGPLRDLLEERSMWDSSAIPAGSRPLDYLRLLAGASPSPVLVIHGNFLAADEIEFVAARRDHMSIVYCPRTHDDFNHPRYPLESMRQAGVRVALGTDSRASNPDLDLLAEARFAAGKFPGIAPGEWLRMITIDAAAALGLAGSVGSLTVGKRADCVALDCDARGGDPYAAIVGGPARLCEVWLGGVRCA